MVRRTLRPRNPERLLGGCRSGHRVVRMHGPVGVTGIDRLARAPVEIAGFQTDHGDAVLDGTDIDAEIAADALRLDHRSEEHTSELQSLMRTSYAVFCLKKKKIKQKQ